MLFRSTQGLEARIGSAKGKEKEKNDDEVSLDYTEDEPIGSPRPMEIGDFDEGELAGGHSDMWGNGMDFSENWQVPHTNQLK